MSASQVNFHATIIAGNDQAQCVQIVRAEVARALSLDISQIDASPHLLWVRPDKQTITRQQVTHIIHELHLTQESGQARCVVLEQANRLSLEAANVLLKPMEEPPRDTLFFLITPSAAMVPATIRSRCIVRSIASETYTQEESTLETVKKFRDGNIPQRFVIIAELSSQDKLPEFYVALIQFLRQAQEYAILEWMHTHQPPVLAPNYRLFFEALAVQKVMT